MPSSSLRLLAATIALLLTTAAAPPALPPTGPIVLAQSDQRLFVMMQLGDGELLPMIFDTGSDGHSIDRIAVRQSRLRTVGTTLEIDGTTGKRRTLPTVAIPHAKLGGLDVGSIEAVALDYDRTDAMGIISPDMFTGRLVRLDLARNRAQILEASSATIPAEPATPYEGALPTTLLALPDGSRIPAHLDTGFNGELSLPLAMKDKITLVAPATVVGHFHSINTDGEVYGGQVRGPVCIGPLTLDSPHVTFLGEIANIGLPVLRRVTLVLDPAAKRSWLLPASPGR